MSKLFFTSDTHFGDYNALKYNWSRRIFKDVRDMNNTIINNWNSVVGMDDTVWHLGDFCHNQATTEDYFNFYNRLNGKINLLKGNHDIQPNIDIVFTHTANTPVYKEVTLNDKKEVFWLCHYPVQRNLTFYTLTGHIHEKWRVQRRMLNVGQDVNNFFPLSVEDVLFSRQAEEDGHWDANVYPDAPLAWQVHVSRNDRKGNEPTKPYLQRRMNNE